MLKKMLNDKENNMSKVTFADVTAGKIQKPKISPRIVIKKTKKMEPCKNLQRKSVTV